MPDLPWLKVDRARLRESRLYTPTVRSLIWDLWDLMASSREYGRMVDTAGKAMPLEAVARLLPGGGCTEGLQRLVDTGFMEQDENGVLFDPIMAHDERIRDARSKAGVKGMASRYNKTPNKGGNKPSISISPSSSASSLGEGMQGEGDNQPPPAEKPAPGLRPSRPAHFGEDLDRALQLLGKPIFAYLAPKTQGEIQACIDSNSLDLVIEALNKAREWPTHRDRTIRATLADLNTDVGGVGFRRRKRMTEAEEEATDTEASRTPGGKSYEEIKAERAEIFGSNHERNKEDR